MRASADNRFEGYYLLTRRLKGGGQPDCIAQRPTDDPDMDVRASVSDR